MRCGYWIGCSTSICSRPPSAGPLAKLLAALRTAPAIRPAVPPGGGAERAGPTGEAACRRTESGSRTPTRNSGAIWPLCRKRPATSPSAGCRSGTGTAHRFPIDQLYISLTAAFDVRQAGRRRKPAGARETAGSNAGRRAPGSATRATAPPAAAGDRRRSGRRQDDLPAARGLRPVPDRLARNAAGRPVLPRLGDGPLPDLLRLANLHRCIQRSRDRPDAPTHDEPPPGCRTIWPTSAATTTPGTWTRRSSSRRWRTAVAPCCWTAWTKRPTARPGRRCPS